MTNAEIKAALMAMLEVDIVRYPDVVQQSHINQIIRTIQQEFDNPYSEATDTLVTVASQAAYNPLTALAGGSPSLSFSHCGGLYYLGSDGTEKEVLHKPWEVCRADFPLGTDEGAPQRYAIRGGNIVLFPTPDAAYTLYCDYWGYLANLSVAGDSNYWTINEPLMVQYGAAIHGSAYILEDRRIPVFQSLFADALDRVLIAFSQVEQSGKRPASEEY